MISLPHCDELFQKFFAPWYREQEMERRQFRATRPDIQRSKDLIGVSASRASPLTSEDQKRALDRVRGMAAAAQKDWRSYLELPVNVDLRWIARFDEYYDLERIHSVIGRSDPEDFSNDYIVICAEFGAVLGDVMCSLRPRLEWLPDCPYWESSLLDSQSGSVIPVFHWAIKKMSGYGWNDGLVGKVKRCIASLDEEGEGQNVVVYGK